MASDRRQVLVATQSDSLFIGKILLFGREAFPHLESRVKRTVVSLRVARSTAIVLALVPMRMPLA